MMKNKSNYLTIFLIMVIAVIFIIPKIKPVDEYNFDTEDEYVEIEDTSGEIVVGKDIEPGFYDIEYENEDSKKFGEVGMNKFKDGDQEIAKEYRNEGNKVSINTNGGKFIFKSTNFENKITDKIEHVGSYPIGEGGLIKEGKYEFCNNGDKEVRINENYLKSNTCKEIDILVDPLYYTYSSMDVNVVIEQGSYVYNSAEDIDISVRRL